MVAFELAKLIASQGLLTESLVYFTKAFDILKEDPLTLSGEVNAIKTLSEILMHRATAYEALGLMEMCAKDMRLINQVDPNFRIRYYEECKSLEMEGFLQKSQKIKLFLAKLDRLGK